MTPSTDLTKIERSIWIRAPRPRVWRAITDVKEFSAWFQVIAEGEFAPKARLRMTALHPCGPDPDFYVTIEDVVPERYFSWRWHPGAERAPEGEPTTLVEFRLEEENGGTRVTVVESGFDRILLARRAKAYEENTQGWEHQLRALDGYLTHA